MLRRALALGLLLVGGLLIARVARHPAGDLSRFTAVVGLVLGGAAFNVVSLVRRHLDVRPWLRGLAIAVGGLLLIGVLATSHYVRVSVVPGVPPADVALRTTLHEWQGTLLDLSLGLGYLVLSIAVLPWPKSFERSDDSGQQRV